MTANANAAHAAHPEIFFTLNSFFSSSHRAEGPVSLHRSLAAVAEFLFFHFFPERLHKRHID